MVGSQACTLQILAIPRLDNRQKFSSNVMSLSWHMELTLIIYLKSCHFNVQVLFLGGGKICGSELAKLLYA